MARTPSARTPINPTEDCSRSILAHTATTMSQPPPPAPASSRLATLTRRLAEPFPLNQLGWLPKSKQPTNGQVRVVPYLEVGAVRHRLTDVLGLDGWEVACEPIAGPHAAVVVTLRARLGETWVSHADVGAAKPRADDPHQALQSAASNGLKRAAESLGVGAYLKRLGPLWMAWDAKYERVDLDRPPQLPAWARPAPSPATTNDSVAHAVAALAQEFGRCTTKELFGLLRYSHRWLLRCGLTAEQARGLAATRAATATRLNVHDQPESDA